MAFVNGPLPTRLKLIHGSGAVAFGVKDSGFSFFLLPYYNLVLGVEALTVGLALATALIVDAFIDPLLGNLSDRTYTRWGRRLPWLYLAPMPLALMWILLWSPPFTGTPGFGEIVALAVGVRVLLSACEVPSVSLVPEITDDYVERTTLFRFRFLSAWLGGLLMMVMAFYVFLPTPADQLQPDGYRAYGIFGASVIVLSVIGSALGQHRLIARRPDKPPPPFSLGTAFGEILDAFRERAFIVFAIGALAAYVGQGMTFSITQYLNLYVWQFNDTAFQVYPAVLALSVVIMFVIVGPLHHRHGKPKSAGVAALVSMVFVSVPYVLFLAGLFPTPGTTVAIVLVLASLLVANTAAVVSMISATSMVAEIIEAHEDRTGRRADATFYSGNWLVQKCATGVGILASSLIVQSLGIEAGTAQADVADGVVTQLAAIYLGVVVVFTLIAAYWLARFPISREEHEARIAARAAAGAGSGAIDADPIATAAAASPDGQPSTP